MIRTARAILDTRANEITAITDIAIHVVMSEIDALKRTCIADLGRIEVPPGRGGFVDAVLEEGWPDQSTLTMISAVERDAMSVSVPFDFQVGLYFYVTVAEIFDYGLAATVDSLRNYCITDDSCVDRLAHARITISVNPDIAWRLITRFRAARGMATLQPPASLLG